MQKDVFLTAIQAAGAVAAAAVSRLPDRALANPDEARALAASAFRGCFDEIVKAVENGQLDGTGKLPRASLG